MIMNVKKDLEIPRIPNYILVSNGNEEKVRLGDLEPDELIALAEEWKKQLLARAVAQRIDGSLNPNP